MCLPDKSEQSSSGSSSAATSATRSIVGIGGLMLLACLAGPALAGALGALGAGVLVGAGGVIFALALCAVVPAAALAWRRRSARRAPTPEL